MSLISALYEGIFMNSSSYKNVFQQLSSFLWLLKTKSMFTATGENVWLVMIAIGSKREKHNNNYAFFKENDIRNKRISYQQTIKYRSPNGG